MYILKKIVLIYINLYLYLLIHLLYVLYSASIRHVGISAIEIQFYYYYIYIYIYIIIYIYIYIYIIHIYRFIYNINFLCGQTDATFHKCRDETYASCLMSLAACLYFSSGLLAWGSTKHIMCSWNSAPRGSSSSPPSSV